MNKIIEQTLVLFRRDNQILLCMDKGKEQMGGGKYNGPGGHVEPTDESIEASATRECQEEVNSTPQELAYVAEVNYIRPHSKEIGHIVMHVLSCTKWEGEPEETDTMVPKWFDENKMPYKQMWESDKRWMRRTLGGEVLRWTIYYDKNDHVTSCEAEPLKIS